MAILAATAIIALEDSGIIGRSKNTTAKQNYIQEYERLQVIKNGILTDNLGEITVAEYINKLKEKGIIEEGQTTNADSSITVTTKTGFLANLMQDGESNIIISLGTANATIALNPTTLSGDITSGPVTKIITATTTNVTGNITWTSSNPNVATVTGSNEVAAVTLKTNGTATITATYGNAKATCEVTVTGTVSTPVITLNKTTISKTINSGSTATETITATTQNITGSLTWTSSNTSVATVSASGNTATITMKAGGTAVITAKNGSTSASCTVTVTEKAVTYTISGAWTFNTKVTLPSSTISEIGVTYTSNSSRFKGMVIGTTYISYIYPTTAKVNNESSFKLLNNTNYTDGFSLLATHVGGSTTPTELIAYNVATWTTTAHRTVNFGTTPQNVSAAFYNWVTANAVEGNVATSTVTILSTTLLGTGQTPGTDYVSYVDWNDSYLVFKISLEKTNPSEMLTFKINSYTATYDMYEDRYCPDGSDPVITEITSTSTTITYNIDLTLKHREGYTYANTLEIYNSSNKLVATYEYYTAIYAACMPAGTLILVEEEYEDENGKKKKRRRKKRIEDLTYDDDLVVWDFDNGCFTTAKPLWLKKAEVADEYNELTFSNGAVLKTVREHRIFNKELGKFTYPMGEETRLGTTTFTEDGEEVTLVNRRVVDEKVEYYNVITNYHINAFAEGILTSCRLSNLYDIKDMKYVKDDREIVDIKEFKDIPEEYYYGLRLGEQRRNVNNEGDFSDLNSWTEYVNRLISRKK